MQPVPEFLDLELSAAEAQQRFVLFIVVMKESVLVSVWKGGLGDQVDHFVED